MKNEGSKTFHVTSNTLLHGFNTNSSSGFTRDVHLLSICLNRPMISVILLQESHMLSTQIVGL